MLCWSRLTLKINAEFYEFLGCHSSWWEHWWLKSVVLGSIPSDFQHFFYFPLSALFIEFSVYGFCIFIIIYNLWPNSKRDLVLQACPLFCHFVHQVNEIWYLYEVELLRYKFYLASYTSLYKLIFNNPLVGIRFESRVYSKLDRPQPHHSSPHEFLGAELSRGGNEFGPETQYG